MQRLSGLAGDHLSAGAALVLLASHETGQQPSTTSARWLGRVSMPCTWPNGPGRLYRAYTLQELTAMAQLAAVTLALIGTALRG